MKQTCTWRTRSDTTNMSARLKVTRVTPAECLVVQQATLGQFRPTMFELPLL